MRQLDRLRPRPAAALLMLVLVAAMSAPMSTPVAGPAHAAPDRQIHQVEEAAAQQPDDVVAQLQELLSHHATLAIRLTRATLTDDPGFVDTAESALVRVIDDMEVALTPILGETGATRFSSLSERQTQLLFRYAAGVRDGDAAAQRTARSQLERAVEAQAGLLADLSSGGRDRATVITDALRAHSELQLSQVEAFDRGDYERAYELQRAAFADTFALAATAAKAAVRVPPPTPSDELQTALAMLLGEHVELAIDTMRSGATGSPDFEAAAGALNANTQDVTDAMDALFGPERARQFNDVWADHIDLFVAYTVAVVEDDTETMEAVRDRFDRVMRRFGTTLQAATGGAVDADVVTEAMGQHEQMLIDQIEQYADGNFTGAHRQSYMAYAHIRQVADVLSTAFARAVADDMPQGGPETGGGGMAAP